MALRQIFLKSNVVFVKAIHCLFIIALEILKIAILNNKEIVGIKVRKREIKLNVFADDLTTFVNSARSFFSLKRLLNSFREISGLQLCYAGNLLADG